MTEQELSIWNEFRSSMRQANELKRQNEELVSKTWEVITQSQEVIAEALEIVWKSERRLATISRW